MSASLFLDVGCVPELVKHGEHLLLALEHEAHTVHHFVLEVAKTSGMAAQ